MNPFNWKGRLVWGLMAVWTFLVAASLLWNLHQSRQTALELASAEAQLSYNKDLAHRLWAASHGGIYVPVTPQTPPNPYLSHIPERDIETPSGRALTLMNPAYMTRQVHELAAKVYGIKGHLTSLKPIRPENAPDAWEIKALNAFESGTPEISEVVEVAGEPHLRFMRPWRAEKACLKCHAAQGYKEGDIRGGISVDVPLKPFLVGVRAQTFALAGSHGLIWILGLTGIIAGNRRLQEYLDQRQQAEEALRGREAQLQTILDSLTEGLVVADLEGNLFHWNPAAVAMHGFASLEEGRRRLPELADTFELATPEDGILPLEQWPLARILRGETLQGWEVHLSRPGTDWQRFFSYSGTLARDEDGQPLLAVVAVSDVTERKQAEESLHRSYQRLDLLGDTASQLLAAGSPQRVVDFLCRKVMDFLDCDVFFNFLVESRQPEIMRLNAWAGIPDEEAQKIEWLPYGVAVCGCAARDACRIVAENILTTPDPRTELVKSYGIQTYACHPLKVEGRVLGTLSFGTRKKTRFSSDELSLMNAVADQVAIAMDRKRAEEELRESQRQATLLADLMELSSQPFGTGFPDGRLGIFNTAFPRMLGYSKEDFLALDWIALTPPEWLEKEAAVLEELQRTDQPVRYEKEYWRKDGTRVPVELLVHLRRDEQGEPSFYYAFITDISERKRAEAEVQRLASFPQMNPAPVLEIDFSGVITFYNQAVVRAVENMGSEAQMSDFIPGDLDEIIAAAREKKEKYFYREVKINDVVFAQNIFFAEPFNVLRIYTLDITKRKRAEEELHRTLIDLARSNQDLEEFAYVASHDLQEPLRKMANFSEMLANRYQGQLDDRADKYLGYIVDGAKRMKTLINDLLALSRLGRADFTLTSADLNDILRGTLNDIQPLIREKQATITHEPLPTLEVNPYQMGQLLQNLITNAIKFHGDQPPRIHLAARQEGREWVMAVRDNGIGFDSEHAGRIFKVFQRLHTKEEYPGTGIGLAICQKIVERHGGRIWAESEPGQGATFYFTIPA